MNTLELPWLPAPPPSFGEVVRALRQSGVIEFGDLRRLATARLNLSQLTVLARACEQVDGDGHTPTIRLRVLSNATTDLVVSALTGTAPRHGLLLRVSAGAYGSWMQEALDTGSETHRLRLDVVLLALDLHAFDFTPCPGNLTLAEDHVRTALQQVQAAAGALQRRCECVVLLQTLVDPGPTAFGSMEAQVPGTTRWQLDRFNRELREHSASGQLLLDVAQLAAQVGTDRWLDLSLWNMGKFPLSAQATPLYADHVCRLLMAVRGLARKCLVLDLDNTVWGGVIGDDGLSGIVIGQGSAAGEAYLAVQAAALTLRDRGVVLAVSSKNDDVIARQPFRERPEMLLREEHFTAFQANWQDKASNLRAIAKSLNIGIDALVLLDDNPAERHQVRAALPEVAVPELPDTPEDYASLLLAAGYFEAVQFTEEDRQRARQYHADTSRAAELGAATDLDAHLASLEMIGEITRFDGRGRARVAQLINKTNQFNLTTKRRSEVEIEALEGGAASLTMQVRLKDRFGDNGMICVVICLPAGDEWLIDTWLMSCRVLNRRVEHAVLNALVEQAAGSRVRRLVGLYVPTAKNGLVRDLYPGLGFAHLPSAASAHSGSTKWVLDLSGFRPLATHVRLTQEKTGYTGAATAPVPNLRT